MSEDNASLETVRPNEGGNGDPSRNQSIRLEYAAATAAWQRLGLAPGLNRAAAIALLSSPLGAASFAGLPNDSALAQTVYSTPSEIQTEAYNTRSTGRARLARLKAERFSAVGRETRIKRAVQALATMPDTIRVNDEDARWIAENPDIEDL